MKKPIFLVLALFLVTSLAVGAAQAHLYGDYEGYEIVKVFVDGQELKGVLPSLLINGQVMVPADGVAKLFNKEMVWNEPMRFLSLNAVYTPPWQLNPTTGTGITTPEQPGYTSSPTAGYELGELEPFSLKGLQDNTHYALKAVESLEAMSEQFNTLVQAEYYGWNRTTLQDEVKQSLQIWKLNIEYTDEFFSQYRSDIRKVLREGSSKRSSRYYERAMDRLDDGMRDLERALKRKEKAYDYWLKWQEKQTTSRLDDHLREDEKANDYLRDARRDLEYFQETMDDLVNKYLDDSERRR